MVSDDEEELEAAQLNAEISAKMRVSRKGKNKGLASPPPTPSAMAPLQPGEASKMSGHFHSSYGIFESVLAKFVLYSADSTNRQLTACGRGGWG